MPPPEWDTKDIANSHAVRAVPFWDGGPVTLPALRRCKKRRLNDVSGLCADGFFSDYLIKRLEVTAHLRSRSSGVLPVWLPTLVLVAQEFETVVTTTTQRGSQTDQ
ncbi:hypothetical protein T265_02535 [Opisthorchis viverrini]|uniref:Uncharacterized protein n=1 Tax=Opisthorchis viverrini TaxID=6198 RepID=A0A074ZZ16_OPIVI|nr:hypothetical protein T265_02535 [Opisthorchis viverrini]KER31217.1 hypothetical protein T265_02535 [Opisthorchis viverrini]